MFGRKNLWERLRQAVVKQDNAAFARLCTKNRDTIIASFSDWQQLPGSVRDDPNALNASGNTLLAIAQYFEQNLGIPALLQAFSPAEDEQVMNRWREMLNEVDELKDRGAFPEALAKMAPLLELTKTIESPIAIRLFALAYGRYGELYFRLGDLKQSRKFNELALQSAADAGDASVVLIYIKNIFELARVSKDYPEMEKWSEIGANTCQQLGLNAELTEWQLRLAEAKDAQGRWTEAAKTLDQAVPAARKALASNKLDLSVYLNNGAELYRCHNEFDRARPLYEEAIKLRRSTGKRDVTLAQFLHNLAFLHQQSPDIRAAGPLLDESLAINRSLMPPDDPLITETLNNLGVYYDKLGNTDKARECYQEALRLRTLRAGADTEAHAASLHNWAELELSVGNDPSAKGLLDRLDEATPSLDNTEHFYRISRVAALYQRLGKYDDAERLMVETIDFLARSSGTDAPDYARAQATLASIYSHQGRDAEAEELFRAVETRMRTGGDFTDEDLSTVMNNIGLFYYDRARNAEAEKYLLGVRSAPAYPSPR